MHEGGIRTFGLVRWPGKVPAARVDENAVVGGVDFVSAGATRNLLARAVAAVATASLSAWMAEASAGSAERAAVFACVESG